MFSPRPGHHGSSLGPRQQKGARELTQQESDEIKYAFDIFDKSRTGRVSARELKAALRALGFQVKKKEVLELIDKHGSGNTATVDFATFKRVVAEKVLGRSLESELRRAFNLFDVDETGKIDLKTLRKIVNHLGLQIDVVELEEMISEFDQDKDGVINELEFMEIMKGHDDL